jgi:hypothetical protein
MANKTLNTKQKEQHEPNKNVNWGLELCARNTPSFSYTENKSPVTETLLHFITLNKISTKMMLPMLKLDINYGYIELFLKH